VIAVCRKSTPALVEARVSRVVDNVDVSEDTGIARLKEQVKGETIDLLINNAGIFLVCKTCHRFDFILHCHYPLRCILHVSPIALHSTRVLPTRIQPKASSGSGVNLK
jgi:NAD(P)-dependent dehydrogenase (short-subunit alcohol dehydrogenase family)